jgi:hypothetical protein
MFGDAVLAGEPDLLRDVPASTYCPEGPVEPFLDLDFEEVVPSETRFFFLGGCCCSIRRKESSTIATFLLSLSVGSVNIPS